MRETRFNTDSPIRFTHDPQFQFPILQQRNHHCLANKPRQCPPPEEHDLNITRAPQYLN